MPRSKNRRQANSEPLLQKKKQTTRKTKSLSNRHKKKNIKIKNIEINIFNIKRLTEEILYLVDNNKTETVKMIKSINTDKKKIDLNKIEKELSDLKDSLVDKIQEMRGEEGIVDGRDFNNNFDPEYYANIK